MSVRREEIISLSFQWSRFAFFRTGTKYNLWVLGPCSTPEGIHSRDRYFTQFAGELFCLSLAWGTVLGQGRSGREHFASRSGCVGDLPRYATHCNIILQPVWWMASPTKIREKNNWKNIYMSSYIDVLLTYLTTPIKASLRHSKR